MAKARPVTRPLTIGPTAQRMAKGDLAPYTPREFVPGRDGNPGQWRELDTVIRVRGRYESPLVALLNRGSISGKMFQAGISLGDAYLVRHREQGTINLNGAGGGRSGGMTQMQCEAQDVLNAAWRALPVIGRDEAWNLLIAVCAQHFTIREIAGTGGRQAMAVSDRLRVALHHLTTPEH